ncbi:MAG: hypothetical protein RIC55_30100 [Pirellulaceae bacterium]
MSDREVAPVAANPYLSPSVDVHPTVDSPLVRRVKRRTGNDLILCALLATICAFILPLGFLLEAVSLFLLVRVPLSRSKPAMPWMVCGIALAGWNVLNLGVFAWSILLAFS